MIKLTVQAPQKPDYLIIRGLIQNTSNVKDNKWITFCKRRDEQKVRVHMQDAGITILPDDLQAS